LTVRILDSSFRPWLGVLLSLMVATTLAACNEQTDVAEPAPRPVRTVTLEKSEAGVPVVLTGRIEALDEASLGFRLSGRMIERTVNAPHLVPTFRGSRSYTATTWNPRCAKG